MNKNKCDFEMLVFVFSCLYLFLHLPPSKILRAKLVNSACGRIKHARKHRACLYRVKRKKENEKKKLRHDSNNFSIICSLSNAL